MKRCATSGIHHKKRQVEASTTSQKLVKALDYYVVIVTGWKHHYYTGLPVYFVVWHVAACRCRCNSRARCGTCPLALTARILIMHEFHMCFLDYIYFWLVILYLKITVTTLSYYVFCLWNSTEAEKCVLIISPLFLKRMIDLVPNLNRLIKYETRTRAICHFLLLKKRAFEMPIMRIL